MSRLDDVLAALAGKGLLLKQDKQLPSVVGIVTGESLRTSWWSHPNADVIFSVLSELADHRDIVFTKLLYRKVTLVHRRLWPSLLAVAEAQDAWQVRGLSPPAKRLLSELERGGAPVRARGPVVRELQTRLLATAREIHTNSGRHEMVVESWHAWSQRTGSRAARSVTRAREALELATQRFGAPVTALPWPVNRAASQRLTRRRPWTRPT
jgi:hypothetical protein